MPDPNPKLESNSKMEEPGPFPDQGTIPEPDTTIPDQDQIDSNLLVKDDQDQDNVIDRELNQDPPIDLPSDALAANAIVVTRTIKPQKKLKT